MITEVWKVAKRGILACSISLVLTGCFTMPLDRDYAGPPARPRAELDEYYFTGGSYFDYSSREIRQDRKFVLDRLFIETYAGRITVDYFKQRKKSDDLILVFPVLGGRKNLVAGYFAEYFARNGFDAAIIHRNNDFKRPENVDDLEEILRLGVIRDRITLDFFEQEYQKNDFGSFGISRGGINVAISAGVDPRLKFNVIALGGTKLVKLFAESKERRIRRYREKVQSDKDMTYEEFVEFLEQRIKTDPASLAHYLDARNTLMFLSLFDATVPIEYGRLLRKQIGNPKTAYLVADHRTGALYTQFVPLIPPDRCLAVFPFDYIESEALHFFNERFETGEFSLKPLMFSVLQTPFNWAFRLFGGDDKGETGGAVVDVAPKQ